MAKKKRAPARKTPAVVLPAFAPPKSSPFAGISGTNAPARETSIPHLTAQVAIAKARKERLQQGGLLTAPQRAEEQKAAKVLAKPAQPATRSRVTPPKRSAAKAPGDSTTPIRIGAPAAPPSRTPALGPSLPPQRRGAPLVVAGRYGAVPQPQDTGDISLGDVARALAGPAIGQHASQRLMHGIDVGVGTTAAALTPSVIDFAKHPIREAEKIKERGLVTSTQAAAGIQRLGTKGGIPKGFTIPTFDLVGEAAAASGKKAITPEELARLEEQGVDLKPRLRARFLKNAAKNGWNPAELDGLSGSALIDKAFTKPPALPLRVAANFAGGVAKLGTLPAGVEGAIRETAAGHGGEVARALGEGLISEVPGIGKHKTTDTAVADPFGFITQFAGAGKTAGTVAGLARAGLKSADKPRVVKSAASGLEVEKAPLARNAYTATGELIAGKAQSTIPRVGQRLEAEVVNKAVRRAAYRHAPQYVKVQRPYKKALDKVGHKRAAELSGYQMAGGKPEQLAAFYRTQGNADNAKFFDQVAERTKTLTEKDHAFLDAHQTLAQKTTQANIDIGKFGPTAAQFRAYSPLIRSAAHLGNPEAQRVLALRDEYLKGFNVMPEEDLAALRGAIDQGVADFAKTHKAQGGIDPTYVEYAQPRPMIAPPYKPGPGGATGFKKPRGRQKAETGATFESGQYLIDPKAPLVESVRAQRAHLADVLHEDVANAVGKELRPGDVIPKGYVAVSKTNLRGLKQTVQDLTDNPVSAPAYDEFAAQKQGIFDRLTGAAMPEGQQVKRGANVIAIPIGSWKRILDHTRPPSRSAYDRFLKQYQRVLVSYRPSTIVNNTLGSIPLAMTGGAGPKSFVRAAQAMRDPSLAPAVLRGHGVAGSMAPSVRSKVGAGMDFMRAQSARGEDFSRLATYFAKAGPTLKKRAKELEMSADEYQRALAVGDVDPQRLDSFLDHAEKFVGDVSAPDGRLGRFASHSILFHRWVGHMAKLMLYTLPVKHPRRLDVLLTLSNYGEQYRQENGVWPDWYREYLPLFQSVKRIGRTGQPQAFTKTFSTQGVNPFSTLNNFNNPVSLSDVSGKSATEAIKDLVLGVTAPPISVVGKTLFNRPYDSKDAGRFLLGQSVRQIPGVSVVRPQGGMSPDSIPFISEKRKEYTGTRPGSTLPYDFRPGARAEPGVLGALLRYGLGGVYDVPAQGPIHNIEQRKHIGAKARDARKSR